MDVCCHHPEIMFADRSEVLGEHFSSFLPADIANLADKIMHAGAASGLVQSSFRYHLPVRGVEQDFICELVGLGNRNSSKYRWLALINTVDDTARDNWRIRSKNRLLFAVTQASEALMTERRFAEVMNESLYYIGNGIGVDRVYFFAAETDADSEKIYMSQKFEWCSHFVEPQIDHPELQKADMSLFKDMWAQLVNDRPYKAIVASMPDNLTREILSQQAIKSILTIPIFVRGDLWGMIGFDDCQYERNWKGVDIAILKMFAAILSARAHRVGNE
ncbi:MAG: hypothetical protein PsegKO_25420 [Pseudohongiellaceae bacterium]